jgi:RNA polymerase sigma factor for flagellar operon FliA
MSQVTAIKRNGSVPACPAAGATFSPEERERLILAHLPQVRHIARRIRARLPRSVSLDDLVSTGVIGLISAIDRFDRLQDVKLVTYAEYKIRGAILDSLRSLDWAPRQQRKRGKQIQAAISAAQQKLSRSPNDAEVATQLGQTVDQYRRWRVDVSGLNVESIENLKTSASLRVESGELSVLLKVAISKLPGVERLVLHLHCYEELKSCEIAEVLGVSEGRISQLKSQAILRLCSHKQLRHRYPPTTSRSDLGYTQVCA